MQTGVIHTNDARNTFLHCRLFISQVRKNYFIGIGQQNTRYRVPELAHRNLLLSADLWYPVKRFSH